jgi:hypothetical protein
VDASGGAGTHAGDAARRHRGRERIHEFPDRLSDDDLKRAGGSRGGLARVIAERYEISMREAKRYVHDMAKVVRTVEGGLPSRGKQVRRAFERTGREIRDAVARGAEGVRDLVNVLTAGGLAGIPTRKIPRPPPERPAAEAVRGTGGTGGTGAAKPEHPAAAEGAKPS